MTCDNSGTCFCEIAHTFGHILGVREQDFREITNNSKTRPFQPKKVGDLFCQAWDQLSVSVYRSAEAAVANEKSGIEKVRGGATIPDK